MSEIDIDMDDPETVSLWTAIGEGCARRSAGGSNAPARD
jgi:hypothetical protein